MLAATRHSTLLDRTGRAVTFALPLFLTHGRGLAEACIDILAVLFLIRSAMYRDWRWVRQPWVYIAFAWWLWQVICTIPVRPLGGGGGGAFFQSVVAVRFLLLPAALQNWTLREFSARRVMATIVSLCGLYIAFQILVQGITGHNLFGMPRFGDGTLTGPYAEPRAAAPLSRLLLPMTLLGCAILEQRLSRRWVARVAMVVLTVSAAALMVLAGQRMPFALFILGLLIAGMLFRPARMASLGALASLPVLLALARVVSPGSFHHLVMLAASQLADFGHSAYGAVFTRAVIILKANPLTGLGYDAFRHGCTNPAYFHGLAWLDDAADGGGAAICVQHAHNHYLQAATNAGLPGLILYAALVVLWLDALRPRDRSGERMQTHAWRIGLFAAVFIQEWPFASSSDIMNLPLGGWAFLLLGIGLAEAAAPVADGVQPLYGAHASFRGSIRKHSAPG